MKAYKCDRCGALFEPSEDATEYRLQKYDGDRYYDDLDICPSCNILFERWMKEGAKI